MADTIINVMGIQHSPDHTQVQVLCESWLFGEEFPVGVTPMVNYSDSRQQIEKKIVAETVSQWAIQRNVVLTPSDNKTVIWAGA